LDKQPANKRLSNAVDSTGKHETTQKVLGSRARAGLRRLRPELLWASARTVGSPLPTRPPNEPLSPYYPIADAIASHMTVWSPKNWCGPCTITCSLRKFPSESNVTISEVNPTSSTKTLLLEV
jgi:hypothetical protein